MLRAVGEGKATIRQVTGVGHNDPTEDLITSAVFGSLRYLAEDAISVLNAILDEADYCKKYRFNETSGLNFSFWPRWPSSNANYTYVEPDLVVEGEGLKEKLMLIIEVKWGAKLGDDQLKRQWESAANQEGHDADTRLLHLLLVRNLTSEDEEQFENHRQNKPGQKRRITWYRMYGALARLNRSGANSGVSIWASDVMAFLESNGVRSQLGWEALSLDLKVRSVRPFAKSFIAEWSNQQVGWDDRQLQNPEKISWSPSL